MAERSTSGRSKIKPRPGDSRYLTGREHVVIVVHYNASAGRQMESRLLPHSTRQGEVWVPADSDRQVLIAYVLRG